MALVRNDPAQARLRELFHANSGAAGDGPIGEAREAPRTPESLGKSRVVQKCPSPVSVASVASHHPLPSGPDRERRGCFARCA